jgi:hypothetical protein
MINDYLRGRAYIEFIWGEFDSGGVFDFELFLLILFCFWAFLISSLSFCLVCHFLCFLLSLRLFLLLDYLFELFLTFWSSNYASWVLDLNFKLCAFCCQWTHQGGDWEKMASSLIWLWWVIDLPWFEFESETFRLLYLYLYFLLGNHVCLSRGVQVVGAAWRAATMIVAGVETWCRGPGMVRHRSGTRWPNDREVGWRRVCSTPCM